MTDPAHEPRDEPTTGERVRAVVVVIIVAAITIALLAWFFATFVIQGCGAFPGCAD